MWRRTSRPALAFLRAVRALLWLALTGFAGLCLVLGLVETPADLPWTPLDLAGPIGASTAYKLAALDGAPARCRALLDQAGVAYRALPPRDDGAACGFADGIVWRPSGTRTTRYDPAAPALACPLAAALTIWEWQVVRPAAARLLGAPVVEIDHFGSYACRRLYGRAAGAWSEHARAAAIDVAGFRLADGRRVTVARDWRGHGPDAAFLHAVRDGGCRLFATTLSPDYNAAHRDHLHLDEARRGGWGACR